MASGSQTGGKRVRGRRRRLGIALGGGSARGWAHIGILEFLREQGVAPDVIAGTSIGALVGGAEAAGQLERLHAWVLTLEWRDVVGYLDLSFSGGLIRGRKLFDYFNSHFTDQDIAQLSRPFGAVAADLESGVEVWLRDGSLLAAVRASIALPGLFTPERIDDRWLVDGGLVNPVPVSLCRALGADRVIAVDLNADLLERHPLPYASEPDAPPAASTADTESSALARMGGSIRDRALQIKSRLLQGDGGPSLFDVVARSVYIMQVRITRSRMAGDPPDVLLVPRLAHIGMMEFHRAAETVAAGRRCAEAAWPEIERMLAH